jgi:hypothetical protein
MQLPILSGAYADSGSADFRTAYPRNLVPVPKSEGISTGYLRPADGISQTGTAPGVDRGGINWNGVLYRVSGTKLIAQAADGTVTVLGDVGGTGPVTMDYSFDRLGIASGGSLWYWNGTTLTQVTDPDIGTVIDMKWIAGYFMTTDGTNLVTTDLANPASVNPLHYGSAETDPDPIVAVDELRDEAYAFGRYTVQVYQNVGGSGFPFSTIEGAEVTKGPIGTHAYTPLGDTFIFVGSGRNEAPSVYQMVPGNVEKVSTREIDTILMGYTEAQLAKAVVETRVEKNHQHVMIHLPDQCLVYDTIATQVMGEPIWFTLDSGLGAISAYRARGHVWCYNRWNVGDPTSTALGKLVTDVSSHYGSTVSWEFGSLALYNQGNGAIVHELELVCLTGRIALGANPVIWTRYSDDGVTWSQERATAAGKQGQRRKRIAWRTLGQVASWRIQRFRGDTTAHLSMVRLEAQVEGLFNKAMPNG